MYKWDIKVNFKLHRQSCKVLLCELQNLIVSKSNILSRLLIMFRVLFLNGQALGDILIELSSDTGRNIGRDMNQQLPMSNEGSDIGWFNTMQSNSLILHHPCLFFLDVSS